MSHMNCYSMQSKRYVTRISNREGCRSDGRRIVTRHVQVGENPEGFCDRNKDPNLCEKKSKVSCDTQI